MSLIRLTPSIELEFPCPSCGQQLQPDNLHITGMHTMVDARCNACNRDYFLEMPINAGMFYPGILNAATGERCDTLPFDNWYLRGLVDAYRERKPREVAFEVETARPFSKPKIAILNCIDTTYGHALFELFNVSYYLKQQDVDLILLVQKNMRWLVPDGPTQVWTVDIGFGKANDWNEWLAEHIQQEIKKLPADVYLCQTFVQTDSLDYNIEDYSRVQPFPLDEWDERLAKPTVTFIWRNDRFWRKILPGILDNRYTRRLFPRLLDKIRIYFQFRWILRFSEELRKQIPNLDYAIAGMDTRDFKLPDWIKDYRYPTHQDETAREQCRRYAESHLVLGCNGSSLILPGCHSGAMLDIVPGDLWSVSFGSFPYRISDSFGETHYRYTLMPAEVTISRLASTVVAMLRERSLIQLHTAAPWRDHDSGLAPFDWAHYRIKAHELSDHFSSDSGLITKKR